MKIDLNFKDLRRMFHLITWSPASARFRLILGLLAIAVQSALLVGAARGLGSLVESGLWLRDAAASQRWFGITVALQLASLGSLLSGRRLLSRGCWQVVQSIREAVLAKIPSLSFASLDSVRTGDVIALVTSELEMFDSQLRDSLTRLGQTAIHLSFILLTAFVLDGRLTLALALGLLPALWLASRLRRPTRLQQAALGSGEAHLHSTVTELTSGRETLIGVGGLPWARSRVLAASRNILAIARRVSALEGISTALLPAASYCPLLLVVLFGVASSAGTTLSLALTVTFFRLGQQLVFPVQALAMETQSLQGLFRSAERLERLLTTPSETNLGKEAPKRLQVELRWEDVSLFYGDKPALSFASGSIRPGEIIGVEGPSGSGKSTLAAAILQMYPYRTGRISWDGADLRRFSPQSLRAEINYGSAQPFLRPGTIEDVLTMGRPVEPGRFQKICDLSGVTSLLNEKCLRGNDPLDPAALSLGQRQLLQIARLALGNASVVILDEALSAVDIVSERLVLAGMRELFRNKSLLFISHRPQSLMGCDRIIRLGGSSVGALTLRPESVEISSAFCES